ncbi:MAG: pyridoxal-phosphate dependent enzyme [Acidobacteria bacterium]|nr:pyridoxal-phosphate dependent enzyme [Acidobacteriota bacterium]
MVLTEIHAAAHRITGRVIRTPLRRSAWLSRAAGADVFLKLETLQPTFSYKIRGALNAVLRLAESGGRRPLVTASAGNHGRALAHAARDAGLALTVYVPAGAPATKLDAIRQLGADLCPCADYDEAEARAKSHGAAGGALFISPYSHPDVIAGAGTIGVEILEQHPGIDTIVVPIGGGGLISGIAIACGEAAEVVGVEVEASSPFTYGLAAGRIVQIEVGPTLADGLAGNLDPETVTFDIVRRHVKKIVRVPEQGLEDAVRGLAREERLIAEGAGATAVAAVLNGEAVKAGQQVAVVLSGANIDTATLAEILSR